MLGTPVIWILTVSGMRMDNGLQSDGVQELDWRGTKASVDSHNEEARSS